MFMSVLVSDTWIAILPVYIGNIVLPSSLLSCFCWKACFDTLIIIVYF